jgi:hypothetical protein
MDQGQSRISVTNWHSTPPSAEMKLWKSLEAQEIQGFFALGRADRKDMALDSGNVILAQAGKIHHRDTESQRKAL